MKTKEKGVTLIALVTTIVVLIILSSIGITAGTSTIRYMNFSRFKEELKILQTKVNELNQNNKTEIGQELTEEQKDIFNITTISNIIYNGKTEEEKEKIQDGFRYYNTDNIKNDLELESIKREYLINVEYRYIICYKGFEYDGITYYMIDQIDSGLYNVQYNDKNEEIVSDKSYFEVNSTKENDRWKIEVSSISYNGYIDNWQVKYRLEDDTYWKTANGLDFYVTKEGNYYVKVTHGDEIDLGYKLVSIIDETEDISENTESQNIIENEI